jgi:hypothetical protein
VPAPDTTVYQFNFKVGNDLHNVYASDGSEALELLDHFEETILPRLHDIHSKCNAVAVVAAPTPAAPVVQGAATPPPVAAPATAGHLCDHGLPMKLIPAGISKATGKPYKAFYACDQPRGQQCDKRVSV